MASASHHRWSDVATEQMNPLFERQFIIGTNTMLARVTLKKGALVPEHHHVHEQISNILEGSLLFRMEGKETIVRAGEIMCIPPDLPHEVVALEDSVALEVFNPPRHDWVVGNDAYLRSPAAGKQGNT